MSKSSFFVSSSRCAAVAGFGACFVFLLSLGGCEKLLAGLVAPSPGDFVQALRAKQAEADASKWTPIVGATALSKNPRHAFKRCLGKTDDTLLRCLAEASRIENESLPLVEACEQGNGLYANSTSCVDFIGGLSPAPKSLEKCSRAFGYDWASCLLEHSPRRANAPVRAHLLHDLQTFARLEEARKFPQPLKPVLSPDPTSSSLFEASADLSSRTMESESSSEGEVATPEAPTPVDEATFLTQCLAALPREQGTLCDDLAPEAKANAFSAQALRLCLLSEGEPRNPAHSADCLSRVKGRIQTRSGLAACEQAFDKKHRGYLFFVKACTARSGHPRYDAAQRAFLESELREAAALDGPSRAATLERYEDLAIRIRNESPL